MIIYRESGSFIQIFGYPDSQHGNGGLWISNGSLYMHNNMVF